ncbi:MAG TPA: hypothetical protein VHU14_05175 [Solirubrobacterales bacterium]|nr:hypothetical protein [Solirubrobacterales bacterium]
MVIPNAIDVIQDHRHRPAAPNLGEAAKLALRLLPMFQVVLAGSSRIEVISDISQIPAYFLRIRQAPPVGQRPSARKLSAHDFEAAIAALASSSV